MMVRVTFIIHAQGTFYRGNHKLNFAEGDIYFFGPMFPHYFDNKKGTDPGEPMAHSVIVQFQQDFLGEELFERPEFVKIKELLKVVQSSCIKLPSPDKNLKELFLQLTEKKGIKRVFLLLDLLDHVTSIPGG